MDVLEKTDAFEMLMEDPRNVENVTFDQLYRMTADEVAQLQEHWVKRRFADLRSRISMLRKLADEQGIETVSGIDDIPPLLFSHTVYKSYPLSYLERNRFDKLTKWLGGLTTTDLSAVEVEGIESIDDWIQVLDAKTDLMIFHSSGTTGKLSFIPRNKNQGRIMAMLTGRMMRDWHGAHSRADMTKVHRPLINPGYQYGAATAQRLGGFHAEQFAGGFGNVLYLYPDQRFSADMQSLAGRIRNAESRGELGSLQIPEALLRRREELLAREKKRPEAVASFLREAVDRFGGQDVFVSGTYPMLFNWAQDGLARGEKAVFGPGSFVAGGGGMKGFALPDDFREQIKAYLGVSEFNDAYAMTEGISMAPRCGHGKYHFNPLKVIYLLDPKTGEPLPRRDGTKGRMAFFDLIPDTYWAGFVSGDEVTVSGWQRGCACGRTGLYAEPEIRRYSEIEGGDDKVMCSGAPDAHDKAAEFLADYAG